MTSLEIADSAVDQDAFWCDICMNQAGGVMEEGQSFAQLQNALLDLQATLEVYQA